MELSLSLSLSLFLSLFIYMYNSSTIWGLYWRLPEYLETPISMELGLKQRLKQLEPQRPAAGQLLEVPTV